MAVDFYLTRGRGRRGRRREQHDGGPPLPEINAQFADSEFPRFLTKIAQDAGLGEQWATYHAMADAQIEYIHENMDAIRRTATGRAAGKAAQLPATPPPSDPRVLELGAQLDAWREAMMAKADDLPIVHLLLGATRRRPRLTSAQCACAGPALRAIAQQWEPALNGEAGWREQAFELANAMDIAAADEKLSLRISK